MTHTNETAIDLNWHPLSEEEIRHFDDNGYLIVRNVLDSDTIDELIEVSDRLMASDRRENRSSIWWVNPSQKRKNSFPAAMKVRLLHGVSSTARQQ